MSGTEKKENPIINEHSLEEVTQTIKENPDSIVTVIILLAEDEEHAKRPV